MKVIKVTPRGYCYGVVDAIQLARRAAANPDTPRPIYVLGQLVHNHHTVEALAALGIVTLDGPDRLALLEQVERGTVIFTAHGVSPAVKERARAKGLHWVDATCPDVERTHELVRRKVAEGHEIVYIGKRGHPEPEGVLGEAPGHVHLVERPEDVGQLALPTDSKVTVTTQTTLSKWDTEALVQRLLARYPQAEVHDEICLATQQRQEAAVAQAKDADVVLVVGDRRSNNSNRLVQVVTDLANKPAHLVDSARDVRPDMLAGARTVAITAGSSTPSEITREVIRVVETMDETDDRRPTTDG